MYIEITDQEYQMILKQRKEKFAEEEKRKRDEAFKMIEAGWKQFLENGGEIKIAFPGGPLGGMSAKMRKSIIYKQDVIFIEK